MKLFNWLRSNFETVRGVIYLGTGLIFSAVSLSLQTSFQPIYVSSVFDIGFEGVSHKIVKSTSGYLESREDVMNCVLKIVLPFDSPPPAISPQYLCSWDSSFDDALCYKDFECSGIRTIYVLSLVSPLLFVIGYLILNGLLFYMKYRQPSRKAFLYIFVSGMVMVVGGFVIVKTIPYITDYLLREVFRTIRSVTLYKGGVNYLEFETIKYILHRDIIVARALLDVLAGASLGLMMMMVDKYRRSFV
jgi:hypothetical protein